ncbi:MAG: cysteine hydrolase [Oscillospiraceae bacterium]|nr:cysteine hydrolase [Oscillospiraceae bacterium]
MKILIVVDMQNDFVDGALGTAEAEAIVAAVADKIASWDGSVLVTYDTHAANYSETQEGRNLPVPHCIEGTDGWQLNSRVMEALSKRPDGYTEFRKPTFGSAEMGKWLCELNERCPVEEIELVGLCTDICVISNALLCKAFLPEVPVAVDAACCAGVTPQSHRNALDAMRPCQIIIRNGEE